jgi:hypothetical protein
LTKHFDEMATDESAGAGDEDLPACERAHSPASQHLPKVDSPCAC